jgi:outer membrane protein insertion porin family
MSLVVDRGTLELADLEIVKSRRLDLAGELEVHGSLGAISGVWRGGCTLTGTGLSVAGQDLAAAQGVATYGPGGLAFRVDGKGRGAWVAEGSVSRASEGGLDATVILDAVQLNLTEEFGTEAHAALSGSARVRGPVDALERLELEGNVSESALILGDRTFRTGESAPVTLESGRFSLGPLRIVGDDTDVELQLTYDSIRDELDSGAGGFFDLGALGVWLPAVRASGRVELAAQAVGPLDRPDFSGALRSNDSRIRWLGFPQALDELSFTLRLDRQQAELLDLRARMGNGEIRGDGAAEFEGFRVGSFAARIRGANVRLLYPEGFRGIYEGDLTLSGTEDSARLSGRIELLRGLYDQGFALGLSESSSREYAPVGAESMPDVALDVDLLADGNVWVRNRLAEVESNLELHLGGTLARPEVTGRVWLVEGGKLSYRGVEYQLRTGSVDLVATDRLDPYLTLEADTVVEDYTILLRIEGTLDRFEYELTSEPPLGTEEIIALLTTGQTLEQIDSAGGSSFTGDVAANYFAGAVTDRLEEEIRRVLRLSRLRIDPLLLQGTADPTTRVTVGQEVADDLYVIFSAELGGDRERQIYQMEWLATGKIGFTAERDNLGGVGGSIRYRDRFWLHRPGDRESAVPMQLTPASPESERARLVSIDVEGIPDEEWAEIETVIPVHVGEAFSRSAAFSGVEAIRGYYVRRGWIESQVDARVTPESDGFSVVFQVDPGPQTEVRFDGVSQKEERRLRTLLQGFWTESVFSEDLYADSVQLIVKYFHERGFYTVDVFHVLDVEDDRQVVTFDIDRGQPVRVTYLTILGGEEIEQERVRKQMLTRSSTWLSKRPLVPEVLDDDVQAIRNLYRDQGFLSAKVSSPRIRLATNGRAADVELEIDAGPVYSVSEVRFPDEPFTPDEYREWAEFGPGDVFSKRRLLGAEGRIRGALDTRGYPDARVRGRVELDGTLATVAFEVEAGGFKRFREVVVRGNRRTREKVIRRELGIVPGDLVSREKLLAAQQRLNRLGLFRSVRLTYGPIDDADPAAHKLDVAVEEMAPFSTHVGLGYDSEIRTRVNFAVTNHNLAGYDRVLSVQGFLSGPEKRLALVGQEPRLFALRLPATLNLAWQESERDGFSQTRVGGAVRVDRRFTPVWAGHARYGLDRVTLSDVTDPTAVVEEKLEDLRLGSVGVAMTRVTYDSPFTPTQGALVDLAAALFSRPLLSEASFVALNASAAGVHTFPSGVAAAGAVRVGLAFPFGDTDVVPISERFFAGGSNSLRGFARDSVGPKTDAGTPTGGESLFVINGEFRIPVWRQVHGVIFYDIGNVYATVSDMNLTELRKVLGAGVRLETPIGPFRLEYGRKLDQKEGESAGELYLSIGNPF